MMEGLRFKRCHGWLVFEKEVNDCGEIEMRGYVNNILINIFQPLSMVDLYKSWVFEDEIQRC